MTEIDYQMQAAEWEGMPSNIQFCRDAKHKIEPATASNSGIDLDILRAEGEGMLPPEAKSEIMIAEHGYYLINQ